MVPPHQGELLSSSLWRRKSLRLQQSCDGLDLVSGVFRQASADRTAEIERGPPHENLRGHQVAQYRHILEAALLVEHARLDRQRHECRDDGLASVTRMGLKHREKLSEFHDLIDVENTLLKRADDRRVEPR